MKRITIFLLAALVSALFFLADEGWAKFHWQRLGRAPLIKEKMGDVIDLQRIFPAYRKSVIRGISLAEPDWDAETIEAKIEAAIQGGRVEQVRYRRDQEFIWMIYRPKKTITVVRDVVWSSSKPLTGFEVEINYRSQRLIFFIPSVCGNISLVENIPLPVEVVDEKLPKQGQEKTPEQFSTPEQLPVIVIKRIYFPNWGCSCCSYSGSYSYHHYHHYRHHRHHHHRHHHHHHRRARPPSVRTR